MKKTITTTELNELLQTGQRFQMIDVRSRSEYATGHVPGSINIPMDEIEARLYDLHDQDPVVLICQSGKRAGMTCEWLTHYKDNLMLLEGGTSNWAENGLPIIQSKKTRWSLDRQVRLGAGLFVLTGVLLALFVNPAWIYLALFVGAGLTFAGATDICMMALVLERLPWNRPKSLSSSTAKPLQSPK